jgi:hypothetical protein
MKLAEKGADVSLYKDILLCHLNDAADRIFKNGKDAVNSFANGDEQRMILMGLKRFTKMKPFNTKDARRRIAAHLIDNKGYNL